MLQRIGVAWWVVLSLLWKFRIGFFFVLVKIMMKITNRSRLMKITNRSRRPFLFLIFWNALFWDLLIQNIALGRIFERDIGEDFGNSLLLSLLISFGFATIRPGSLAYIILIVFKFINNADCGYNFSRSPTSENVQQNNPKGTRCYRWGWCFGLDCCLKVFKGKKWGI